MKTSLSVLLLASSLLSAQANVPSTTEEKSNLGHSKEVVVTALGSDGKPIGNLTKEEIGVLVDNAQPATVGSIRYISGEPLHLGIVLFASRSFFPREQAAATALVQKLIRSDSDAAFVLNAGGSRPWSDGQINWQSDKDGLTKTIQSLERDRGIPDAFNFNINDRDEDHQVSHYRGFDSGSRQEWNMARQRDQGTTIFDAVWEMMKSSPQTGRHVLVIFREPWAHATGGDSQSFDYIQSKLASVVATAQRLGVPIYSIGIEDPALMPNEAKSLGTESRWTSYEEQIQREREKLYFSGKTNISKMSDETGGRTYWNSKKDYSDAVNSIVTELQGEYSLTFSAPAADQITSAHSIKYAPTRGGVLVKGPAAYYLDRPLAK